LRGVGGDLIILEEAAYLDNAIFYEVVVPLLTVKGTALIAISTPIDGYNLFSDLCNSKAEGKDVFLVETSDRICLDCQFLPDSLSTRCLHLKDNLPEWKSAKQEEIIKDSFYKGNYTLLKRELMGMSADDGISAFSSESIMRFKNRPTVLPSSAYPPRFLFMALDPTGLGSSELAMTTVYLENGKITVRACVRSARVYVTQIGEKRTPGGFFCTRCISKIDKKPGTSSPFTSRLPRHSVPPIT
jgi:hypothetical protein